MNDLLDEQQITTKDTIHFQLWVILIWAFVFTIGAISNIMHWPMGEVLCILGAAGFMSYSFSFLILSKTRSSLILICSGVSLLWIIILLIGLLYQNASPLSLQAIKTQGALLLTFSLIHFVRLSTLKIRRGLKK
jgi:hypothetical protein